MTTTSAFRMALLLLPLAAVSHAQADVLRLRPGFQQILDLPDVTRISVGNPAIVEARPLTKRDGVLVVGKTEGETDLVVWEKGKRSDWTVEVRERKPTPGDEVRAFTAAFPEITISEAGNSVLIAGSVPSARERALLEKYAEGRPGVHLNVSIPEERKTLLSYDLKIIEISTGSSSQIGVRWPDSLGIRGTLAAGSESASTYSLETDFETRLNLMMADGRARILANPKLVCETGEGADFIAGGEIPIVTVTPESRTVEWKTYGIILKIEPKMDSGNRIRTQITAEISTVDHASGNSSVPGFLTRRVTTFFSTPPGETVMLSGLVRNEMAKDVAKLPLLGHIPILGELFKSRAFRENRSELAVFITPAEIKGDSGREVASWDEKFRKEKEFMKLRFLD